MQEAKLISENSIEVSTNGLIDSRAVLNKVVVGDTGFEPVTSCVSSKRSNQLS